MATLTLRLTTNYTSNLTHNIPFFLRIPTTLRPFLGISLV